MSVAVPWLVECKVKGMMNSMMVGYRPDRQGQIGSWGYDFVTMWSMEALMANMSQSMEYATVYRQKELFRRRDIISEVCLN